MINVSDRWKANTGAGNVLRWLVRVQWTRDGTNWYDADVLSCSVEEDQTSQVRWNSTVQVKDVPVGPEGLSANGGRYKINVGLDFGDTTEWVGKGVYRIETVEQSITSNRFATITGKSLEQQVKDTRFLGARSFEPTNAQTLVNRLITEVLPEAKINWLIDGSRRIPRQIVKRDRWEFIAESSSEQTSIMGTLGAVIFPNHEGVWIVKQVPSLQDPTVWSAAAGEVLIESSHKLDRSRVRNVVVCIGQSTEEDAPSYYGTAADQDPLSETYVGRSVDHGGFGEVPLFYVSNKFTSNQQCIEAARGFLAPRLGLKREVEFERLFDPAIEAGDVGLVDTPAGPLRVLIDSISWDLVECTMSATTRTTATTRTGEPIEVGDDDDGDVEDQEQEVED